jgi:hypothetical protein
MLLAALLLPAVFNLNAVAATPSESSSVTVNNTPANPVPTEDVDNPAKQPFHSQGVATQASPPDGTIITTVPAGKRLVIETITSTSRIDISGVAIVPLLRLTVDGFLMPHTIGLNSIGQDATRSFWTATHGVRLYADPSTNVFLSCTAFINANQVCVVTISGYLVDVP